jgi:predicted aspartyl protease
MGVLFVEGTVIAPEGKQENLKFLLDSGVMYTVLPLKTWRAIGLKPMDSVNCVLEDGRQVKRKRSECQIGLAQGKRHTPVILGAENDRAVLGRITLSEFGLMLNPFTRRLERMRLMLAQQRRSAVTRRHDRSH